MTLFAAISAMGVGQDRGADRASNDADVSSMPPIIPYGGFPPSTAGGLAFPLSSDLCGNPCTHAAETTAQEKSRWAAGL
jgi:hypothetical protein